MLMFSVFMGNKGSGSACKWTFDSSPIRLIEDELARDLKVVSA